MIDPDQKWYLDKSRALGLTARCPHASPFECRRYYYSAYLVAREDLIPKFAEPQAGQLEAFWNNSNNCPIPPAQEPGITRCGGKIDQYTNFCPEVMSDLHKLFARDLFAFPDEIDKDVTHKALGHLPGAPSWRWRWAHCEPLHFSECPTYSLLSNESIRSVPPEANVGPVKTQELLTLRPAVFGFSIDLKVLWAKLRSRWGNRKRVRT
jgi:hypothetical protein